MSGLASKLDANQVLRNVFDEESKKLRVDAQVTASVGNVDLVIDATAGDNIAIKDPTSGHELAINADGSIDANVIVNHNNDSIRIGDGTKLATTTELSSKVGLDVNLLNATITTSAKQVPAGPTVLTYGTISNIAVGATGTIVSYTAPPGALQYYLQKIYISGNQNSSYTFYKNDVIIVKTRMAHTQFSQTMDLSTSGSFGLLLEAGDVLRVDAENNGTGLGSFDATLQFMEISL